MAKTTLKSINRKTTVSRTAVRSAISGRFINGSGAGKTFSASIIRKKSSNQSKESAGKK